MNLNKQKNTIFSIFLIPTVFTAIVLLFIMFGCKEVHQSQKNSVIGSIKDEAGNTYPDVYVKLLKNSEIIEIETDSLGIFKAETNNIGEYTINVKPPLSTELVTSLPMTIKVKKDKIASADIIIQSQLAIAHLNFGNVDVFNEINDIKGKAPTDLDEPIYAANIFDEPLGLLTAIKAPDKHHIILSEWKKAKGNLSVSCNGNTSNVEIKLEGLIPNGTYSFWLAYLNKIKKVGENINGRTDFVYPSNPPLGSGKTNVIKAFADGTLDATIVHPSCILTEEVALVIPILYHINGKTFGSAHVPDSEETVHLLVYFQ